VKIARVPPSGVAALILGNEVLTGKVVDVNGPLLVRELRAHGVPLRCMATLPDEVDAIVEGLHWARRHSSVVVTSGGIGPTHDDVTVQAAAQALGRRVVRLPDMVALLEARGLASRPEVLRLADAPEGAELLPTPGSWLPVLSCDGLFLLPGVPPLFAAQLQVVLPRLPKAPVFLRTLFLRVDETEIAGQLEQVARGAPDLALGSYPQWDPLLDHRLQITVEGSSLERVESVVKTLLAAFPPDSLVRTAP
jgi:molybdenum cofactor synthesis domain-containing protein